MPVVHAIDLSHWNVVTSFREIVESGVVGIIHKCTEGTSYLDPTYEARMGGALDAGLRWGAYHFLKHGRVEDQMRWFIQNCGLVSGSRIAIDHEDPACTLDDLMEAIAVLQDLDDTMQIAVYSGHLIKEQVGDIVYPDLAETSLWLAHYTTGTPTWPKGTWPVWSLWQFTDTGKCPGVEGNCDLNTFNGSSQNCALWFGPTLVQPEPEPKIVEISLKVPEGVGISITVNGDPWAPE